MRTSRRSFLVTLVAALMLSMLAAPVLAATPSSETAGTRYVVVTLKGKAYTRVEGNVRTTEASLNLDVHVVGGRGNWTWFKVREGALTVDGIPYIMKSRGDWGVYNAQRHTAWFKGEVEGATGETARFLLHCVDRGVYQGEDEGEEVQGTLMAIRGIFQDPTGVRWMLVISAYRQRVT